MCVSVYLWIHLHPSLSTYLPILLLPVCMYLLTVCMYLPTVYPIHLSIYLHTYCIYNSPNCPPIYLRIYYLTTYCGLKWAYCNIPWWKYRSAFCPSQTPYGISIYRPSRSRQHDTPPLSQHFQAVPDISGSFRTWHPASKYDTVAHYRQVGIYSLFQNTCEHSQLHKHTLQHLNYKCLMWWKCFWMIGYFGGSW
jgi:hypothetical protein